jgi:hypothetical protein
MNALTKFIAPWLADSDSDDLIALRDHLLWLRKELFDEYEPHRYEAFDDRLVEWLANADVAEDQKSLFRLLNHLFFVGKQQFDSLCRAAFNDQATRWVIDVANLDICDPAITAELKLRMKNTWFCPITDSMRINSFLKLNGMRGHNHRPDWRSLCEFANSQSVIDYIATQKIERIVLLEDFIGSGQQMLETVKWASKTLPTVPILVIPLICCPRGEWVGRALSNRYPNVSFAPALSLKENLFLKRNPVANEPRVFAEVRQIIENVRHRLDGWATESFGYKWTGALVTLFSNCPDNTLPIIHHTGDNWTALFSRIRRS